MQKLLLFVFSLGLFLRFVFLDSIPSGVTADEIQQGYTAFSILKTGKDEWGDFLPLNPRSLGEYKPPLYAYLTIPFVAIFDLNIFSIRALSALAGSLTVLVTFFLVYEFFKNKKIALLAAFFLSASYWHINFSRFGWESNLALFLFTLALLTFLQGYRKNYLFPVSFLLFGLTLFTYNSFRLFTLLFLIGLLFFKFKGFKNVNKKWVIIGLGIFLTGFLTFLYSWAFSGAGRRASDTAIYNPENLVKLRTIQTSDGLQDPLNRIINNRVTFLISEFAQNYLGYFSTTFLASPHRADSSVFNLPGRWLLPIWLLIPLVYGLYKLINEKAKDLKVILLWIFLAPVPAALTRDYMQTLRVENSLLVLLIISSYGFYYLIMLMKSIRLKKIIYLLFGMVIIWSFMADLDYYLFHQYRTSFGGLKHGYKEIVKYVSENEAKYNKIIFTKSHSMPHIFFAFYTKMDPQIFQESSKKWRHFETEGFQFVDMINLNLGKYYFQDIDFSRERNEDNALIIAGEKEIPETVEPLKIVSDPSGKVVFKIIHTSNLNN